MSEQKTTQVERQWLETCYDHLPVAAVAAAAGTQALASSSRDSSR